MFETAIAVRAGRLDGRWIVDTVHQREPWDIVFNLTMRIVSSLS